MRHTTAKGNPGCNLSILSIAGVTQIFYNRYDLLGITSLGRIPESARREIWVSFGGFSA